MQERLCLQEHSKSSRGVLARDLLSASSPSLGTPFHCYTRASNRDGETRPPTQKQGLEYLANLGTTIQTLQEDLAQFFDKPLDCK